MILHHLTDIRQPLFSQDYKLPTLPLRFSSQQSTASEESRKSSGKKNILKQFKPKIFKEDHYEEPMREGRKSSSSSSSSGSDSKSGSSKEKEKKVEKGGSGGGAGGGGGKDGGKKDGKKESSSSDSSKSKEKDKNKKKESKKGSSSSSSSSSKSKDKEKKRPVLKKPPGISSTMGGKRGRPPTAKDGKAKKKSKSSSSSSSSGTSSSSDSDGSSSSSSSSSTSSEEEMRLMKKKQKNVLGIGKKIDHMENDEPFMIGGKAMQARQKKIFMLQERRDRKKKLKEIDVDEYEDEIWLAYVEPQYENEYSRMISTMRSKAAQNPSHSVKEEEIEMERVKIRSALNDLLNPNVEAPMPTVVALQKKAIKLSEFDSTREGGVEVRDLDKPAPSVDYQAFDPSQAYIPLIRRKPYKQKKKRGENEVKLFDFVDSSKAIQGSSSEDEKMTNLKQEEEAASTEQICTDKLISVKDNEEDSPPRARKRGRKPKKLKDKRASEEYDPDVEKAKQLAEQVIVEQPDEKEKPDKPKKKHKKSKQQVDVKKEESKIVKEIKEKDIKLAKRLNPEEDDNAPPQEKEDLIRDEEEELFKEDKDFLMSQEDVKHKKGKDKKHKRQKLKDESVKDEV